jgi:hypothetical protein
MAFPGPKRLPPAGSPCRARVDPGAHRVRARFDRWRLFTRRVAPLRASSARTPSAATEGAHTEPSRHLTDFCNRQRAWAHRRTVASLRTEPAVSAHSVVPVKAGTANGTTSGADAPCARGQGRHRPAAPRVSLHDGSHRGPLASDVPSTSSSFAARCSRIWCREQTSLEPRPDSLRRANGEDLRQAEVLSIPGNPHGS